MNRPRDNGPPGLVPHPTLSDDPGFNARIKLKVPGTGVLRVRHPARLSGKDDTERPQISDDELLAGAVVGEGLFEVFSDGI